jgi:hypothetical protein
MAFKIASAYVAVTPEDDGFEIGLRRIVDEAAAKVEAQVGVGVRNEGPEELRGDLDAAIALATEHLTADVGMGLRNDAVEELDADVKAGVDLVEENNKIKVKVDAKAAQDSFGGLSPLLLGAFAGAATAGPGLVLAAVATAVVAAGALVQKNNAELTSNYTKLAGDASSAIRQATAPLVPALAESIDILDRGVEKTKPELRDLFAAVAPEATQMASGVTQLVENALPGLVTGLREAVPFSGVLAQDFGKLGTGVSEFFSGLGSGALGGATGLDALITVVEHLLGDVGQITGSLSNGLGPALHDIETVAVPVADGLTSVVKAFPPGDIRVAADAAVALFAAFKIASLAGIVAEGTSFVEFLKQAAAGEIALTGETGVLATAMEGLGTAADVAAGPVGLLALGVAASATQTANWTDLTPAANSHTLELGKSVDTLTKSLEQAASGNKDVQTQLDHTAQLMHQLKDDGAVASGAFDQLDQALVNVYKSDPSAATKEYTDLTKQLGLSADEAAQKLPKFAAAADLVKTSTTSAAGATADYADETANALSETDVLTQAIVTQQEKLTAQANTLGSNVVAALSFIETQQSLNDRISEAVGDYSLATGAANAFKQAEDALYGKYASYSQAQATFTEQVSNAAKELTHGKNAIDLNTEAGAKNFTLLNQLATANENVAEALIKQGGSSDEATASLQKGAQAIDDLAKKSGFSDKQIQQLNMDLYGVPTVKQITFTANTSPALQALNGLIQRIDSSSGTVQIYGVGGGRALGANAEGGDVQAGEYSLVGEKGPEIVQFARAGTVIPNNEIRRVGGDATSVRSPAGSVTIQNLTIPITGIVDLTDPNSMSIAARRMVLNLKDALNQVERGLTGTSLR